jgi:hypothetical protein
VKLLIPTKEQFKKWTMLSRMGYIAAVVGIPVGLVQLVLWAIGLVQWLGPSPTTLSAQDLLIIDKNPTKLEITGVEKEKYGTKYEIVTFSIKNTSTVTAKNVRVAFYNYEFRKFTHNDRFSNGYNDSGVDIGAGETRKYKIASINNYEHFFNPDYPGAPLIRVSTTLQSNKLTDIREIACGKINGEVPLCSFSYSTSSTIVDVRYGSIFGQKYHVLTQLYNDFLDGEVTFQSDLMLPQNG